MNRSTESLEEESNIMVAVRVRPLLEKEKKMGEMPVVRVEDNLIVSSGLAKPSGDLRPKRFRN